VIMTERNLNSGGERYCPAPLLSDTPKTNFDPVYPEHSDKGQSKPELHCELVFLHIASTWPYQTRGGVEGDGGGIEPAQPSTAGWSCHWFSGCC
jgi:hypothetical protein